MSLVENIKNATHWSQLIGFTTKYFNQAEFVRQYYKIKYSINEMYYKHKIIKEKRYNSNINKLNNDRLIYDKLLKNGSITYK